MDLIFASLQRPTAVRSNTTITTFNLQFYFPMQFVLFLPQNIAQNAKQGIIQNTKKCLKIFTPDLYLHIYRRTSLVQMTHNNFLSRYWSKYFLKPSYPNIKKCVYVFVYVYVHGSLFK